MLKIYPVETTEDIEIAKMLFTEYAGFLKEDLFEYADVPWLVQYYEDFEKETDHLPDGYEPPDGVLLLAEYDGRPAGCVGLGKLGDGQCEMKRLFVRSEYRNQGIGKALCKAIMDRARTAYTRMRLTTALQAPRILYFSLGFKQIEPFRDVPDEIKDIVFMELKLA